MSDMNHSRSIVQEVIASQRPEIEDMKKWRWPWYKLSLSSTEAVSICLTKNFLMVQAPAFIRGINPKSKIENPQAPAFIRGVASKI